MPFPHSERVIFEINPIQEVICQLRFPTILAIGTQSPAAFQDKLRQDYPLYEQEETVFPRELSDIISKLPVPKPTEGIIHKFLTADSERYISLSPEFIALSESSYVRWEYFRQEIERAKQALEEIYKPAFYTRIGLRYRDIVDREKVNLADASWHELLRAPMIGMLGDPEVAALVDGIQSQVSVKLDEAPGAFATIRHGLVQVSPSKQQVYVIDTDLYSTERKSTNDVFDTLDRFNRILGNFFRWAITPKLQDGLRPQKLV